MNPTPAPGIEAATYGGPGWTRRSATHAEEVAAGHLWARCGVTSEVAPLREVILSWPGDRLAVADDLDGNLLLEAVDVDVMRRQTEALVSFYEAHDVRVHLVRCDLPPPPNFVFMRDVFFMCGEGAVVARMAGSVRAGEERLAARALSEAGVPILLTMRGQATFEGADALWLDERTVLAGCGRRTNSAGLAALAGLLAEMDVACLPVDLPPGTQHLLGVVNFVDVDLAITRSDRISAPLEDALRARGVRTLVLEAGDEVRRGLGMNFVTLAPRHVVMPAGAPSVRRTLEDAGVTCEVAEVGEYLKAAGGLGCLTGILRRGPT